MKSLVLKFLLSILLSVECLAETAALDHQKYVNPQWVKITLMEKDHVRPALAVWGDDALFFTRAIEPKGRCEGEGLFRYVLGTDKPEPATVNLPCVIKLMSNGKKIFVHYSEDADGKPESPTKLGVWDGSGIIDAFSETIWSWHQGKLHFAMDELKWAQTPTLSHSYELLEDRLIVLAQAIEGKRTVFYDRYKLSQLKSDEPNDFPELAQVLPLRVEGEVRQVASAGPDRLFLLRSKANRLEVAQVDLSSGEVTQSYGGFTVPPATWNHIEIGSWGTRVPRFLVGTDRGFIIADRTARLNEARALSFFSDQTQEFFKLKLPAKDLSGLSIPETGGVLMSKSTATQVVWHGPERSAHPLWLKYGKRE